MSCPSEASAGSSFEFMLSKETDAIATLAAKSSQEWKNLSICAEEAEKERLRIKTLVGKLVPADCSLLVFGSLARDEFTAGSDVDWTLLIDGAASPKHLDTAKEIAELLKKEGTKAPGPTGVFGGPIFSHDLVHFIGGETDTNRNTTRRILMLLESRALLEQAGVRERVMRHLFRRYVEEDRDYRKNDYSTRIPFFLLNDIVRYWRTMAVDYASKRRERGSAGWAIRNVKLRLSRKLIFAAGLTMCLSCQLRPSPALGKDTFDSERAFTSELQDFLFAFANRTPLQVVTQLSLDFEAYEVGTKILDAYNQFLGILSDSKKRAELDQIGVENAFENEVFKEARKLSKRFHEALTELFFNTNKDLAAATQRYGVF